jgi:hypothetical protein
MKTSTVVQIATYMSMESITAINERMAGAISDIMGGRFVVGGLVRHIGMGAVEAMRHYPIPVFTIAVLDYASRTEPPFTVLRVLRALTLAPSMSSDGTAATLARGLIEATAQEFRVSQPSARRQLIRMARYYQVFSPEWTELIATSPPDVGSG